MTSRQHVQFNDHTDRDILGFYVDKGYLSIQLFFMRQGKLLSRDFNLMPIYDDEHDEVIRFIVDFYSKNTYPKELLVPASIDVNLLADLVECKVICPEKGNKKDLVEMAITNAKEALEKKFQLIEKTETNTIKAVKELGHKLGIATPHRIDLFDNSNIQGAYAVSGMVVFRDGVPSKNDYRKYKIKTVEGPDDYASMKEVIYRRCLRILTDNHEPPGLIIVDGGKGQIKMAREVIELLNLDIYVCGLAKDDRHQTAVLLDMNGNEVPIDRQTPLFYLLTRMQDEVHRYAISFHRQVRSKSLFDSIIDDVEGIGPKRKKQLLSHFGSVKKMKEATLLELEEVLPKNVASVLYSRLHIDDKEA